jgi:hypothetical protein
MYWIANPVMAVQFRLSPSFFNQESSVPKKESTTKQVCMDGRITGIEPVFSESQSDTLTD